MDPNLSCNRSRVGQPPRRLGEVIGLERAVGKLHFRLELFLAAQCAEAAVGGHVERTQRFGELGRRKRAARGHTHLLHDRVESRAPYDHPALCGAPFATEHLHKHMRGIAPLGACERVGQVRAHLRFPPVVARTCIDVR